MKIDDNYGVKVRLKEVTSGAVFKYFSSYYIKSDEEADNDDEFYCTNLETGHSEYFNSSIMVEPYLEACLHLYLGDNIIQ